MADELRTIPDSPYPLVLVHDGPVKYAGEWIASPTLVQADGNVVYHEAYDPSDPSQRYPQVCGLLGLAGAGPGALKCGQHKVSRWKTIWTGLHVATHLVLVERILIPAGDTPLLLMSESVESLTQFFDRHPVDEFMLLIGGDGPTHGVDWFPTEEGDLTFPPQETDSDGWIPQETDTPTPWDPKT